MCSSAIYTCIVCVGGSVDVVTVVFDNLDGILPRSCSSCR